MAVKWKKHQKAALDVINNTALNGTLHMSVRSGKTLIALEHCRAAEYDKILWIAYDTIERDEGLEKECRKHGYLKTFKKMDVTLIDSLHKLKDNEYDIIIYNECQTITGTTLNTLTNFIHFSRIIGMTGTYPNKKEKQEMLNALQLDRILYQYTTDTAAKDNAVANYQVTVFRVPLDARKNMKVELKDGRSFMTSEQAQYNSLSKKIATSSGNGKKMFALARMRVLNKAQSKVIKAKNFLLKNPDKRILVFAQDSKHSLEITKQSFNSKTDREYFDKFQNEEINHLALLNKASTGTTYENLDGCILLSVNSSNVSILQKIGRSLLFRPNYTARIIILISKDTVQETWIQKALEELDQSKIKYKDLK